MERIILRHLSGSKANQVDEFPLTQFKELTIGRDPASTVAFDPERDDLVGRQHAKIVQDPANPTQFLIVDLNSRNGTFLNRQRIVGSAKVMPGDVVQLGAGGPEIQFDVEPRPAGAVRPTRVAGEVVLSPAVPPTRSGVSGPPPTVPGAHAPVGRATVERMVAQTKRQSNVMLFVGIAVIVVVAGVVGAYLLYQNRASKKQLQGDLAKTQEQVANMAASAPMTPTQIAQAYSDSTVYVEVGWSLINTKTGGQVYHEYTVNKYKDKSGKIRPIVPDGRPIVFLAKIVDNKVEPALTLDEKSGFPIGGNHTGSGFCVTSDGFIITNRHVASTWKTSYHYRLKEESSANAVVNDDDKILLDKSGKPILVDPPGDWVPAESKQFGQTEIGSPTLDGRNDYLNVTFAKNELRFPAQLVRTSDRHDAAMIKIDTPEPVKKVPLYDNYDSIRPGDTAIVLGYPAVSPPVVGFIESKDVFNRTQKVGIIPDPTISVGNVGRVLRGQEATSGRDPIYSTIGDAYQLTINSTGGGNSGGPMFDDHGRVVGIYFAGRTLDAQISFAVPIRYAMELMTTTRVLR